MAAGSVLRYIFARMTVGTASTERVSQLRPRKLGPLMTKTDALSKVHRPISSMMSQEGLTRADTHLDGLCDAAAFMSLSLSSVVLR
jgi:hypothetical protein